MTGIQSQINCLLVDLGDRDLMVVANFAYQYPTFTCIIYINFLWLHSLITLHIFFSFIII